MTAAPASALDWDQPARGSDQVVTGGNALRDLTPGQTIGWLLAGGEIGWGTIAVAGPSTLITNSGQALDRDNCQALWRAHSSRGHTIGTAMGYGLGIGVLASTALYASYQDDHPGSWGNFGVGLGIGAAVVGGLVTGLIAGVVASDSEYWQLIYLAEGADSWQVDRLPDTRGNPRRHWAHAPWVEITTTFGSTGWAGNITAQDQNGLRTALWLPLGSRLDLGGTFGITESSWDAAGSGASAELLLRLGRRTGAVQPYLVGGAGWYGPLGDQLGITFGGGLRVQVARRWAVSVETGAVQGTRNLDGDKPGRAWIGMGLGYGLGTSGPSH